MIPIRRRLIALAAVVAAIACGSSAAAPPGGGPEAPASVTVPSRGSASRLDVASWNVEWFGSTGNGPTDELLQRTRVADVIRGTDADIWGVVEVVDRVAWDALLAGLPGYTGFLADAATVAGGQAAYSAGEQKVGILFKTSLASLVGARVILAHADNAFAGRPPLEVTLRVTSGAASADLVVIVLHMKAFADETSRLRREAAGAELKSYLDATYPSQRVLVIGDWNDDVDVSIVPSRPSPYAAFVADAARYTFVTRPLSDAGVSSTTGYADLIDHHLASNELAAELSAPAQVFRVDAYIQNYAATTSDHFPVLSHYALLP
jgi:endonuclease/exonuclease/phosphatase family metal-dependent hydrolase